MLIIISSIHLFLGLCIVGAAAFVLGVGVGLKAEIKRKDGNKPR